MLDHCDITTDGHQHWQTCRSIVSLCTQTHTNWPLRTEERVVWHSITPCKRHVRKIIWTIIDSISEKSRDRGIFSSLQFCGLTELSWDLNATSMFSKAPVSKKRQIFDPKSLWFEQMIERLEILQQQCFSVVGMPWRSFVLSTVCVYLSSTIEWKWSRFKNVSSSLDRVAAAAQALEAKHGTTHCSKRKILLNTSFLLAAKPLLLSSWQLRRQELDPV